MEMEKVRKQIDNLYSQYKENRIVTNKTVNRTLTKFGTVDFTINEFKTKIDAIVEQNYQNLTDEENDELKEYAETIVDNFTTLSKK